MGKLTTKKHQHQQQLQQHNEDIKKGTKLVFIVGFKIPTNDCEKKFTAKNKRNYKKKKNKN